MAVRFAVSKRVFRRCLVAVLALSAFALLASPDGDASAASAREISRFEPPKLPESVVIDASGTAFVSVPSLRQVIKVSPSGRQETLPPVPISEGVINGVALDDAGSIYAATRSSIAGATGIWRIAPSGSIVQFASLPDAGIPNGVAFDRVGNLYVTDSAKGIVWRVTQNGAVERWLDDPVLRGMTPAPSPFGQVGANGLDFDQLGVLHVAVTDFGRIVRIPVTADGRAGVPSIWVEDDDLVGADGIAFDLEGNLLVAANRLDQLVRVTPTGVINVIGTSADGLDFPSDVAFTTASDAGNVYVTNSAALTAGGSVLRPPRPALLALRIAPELLPYHPRYTPQFRNAPGLFAALKAAIDQAFRNVSPNRRPSPEDILR